MGTPLTVLGPEPAVATTASAAEALPCQARPIVTAALAELLSPVGSVAVTVQVHSSSRVVSDAGMVSVVTPASTPSTDQDQV